MKDDVHRICRNREAVIMGQLFFWLQIPVRMTSGQKSRKQMNQREV